MRILIIHRELPFPADNGGRLRAAHVARHLATHHEVTLLCFSDDTDFSQAECGNFLAIQCLKPPNRAALWRRILSGVPSEVVDLRSDEMHCAIAATVARQDPQVLIVSEPSMAQYLVPFGQRVCVMDYLMVQTLSLQRLAAISRGLSRHLWRLRWQRSVAYHQAIAPMFDVCLVNSQEDLDDLQQNSPGWKRLEFFPNGVEMDQYPLGLASAVPNTIIYPGSVTYIPNRDAVSFMIDKILPRISTKVDGLRLIVTGAVPGDGTAPQSPQVEYTGRVPDVRLPIASAWACVVPLRSGAGGARYKVLEAMALGTPLVSTRIGVEGIEWTDGLNVLIADDPDAFADATVRVLTDNALRADLSHNARNLIEERYDWSVLGQRLSHMLEELVVQKSSRR